jgi:hypothetical protein
LQGTQRSQNNSEKNKVGRVFYYKTFYKVGNSVLAQDRHRDQWNPAESGNRTMCQQSWSNKTMCPPLTRVPGPFNLERIAFSTNRTVNNWKPKEKE